MSAQRAIRPSSGPSPTGGSSLAADLRAAGYPSPASEATTAVMKANRKRDTKPEIALRSALHRNGLRFRKEFSIRPDDGRLIRADVAFTSQRVAVFVDGCFWHSCPVHGTTPRSNQGYWGPKLARNLERDRENDTRLGNAGWIVVRVWEHEPVSDAVTRVRSAISCRHGGPQPPGRARGSIATRASGRTSVLDGKRRTPA